MLVLLKDVVNKSMHSVPGYLPLGLPCFSPFAVEFIKTHYQRKMGGGETSPRRNKENGCWCLQPWHRECVASSELGS